MKNLFYTLLFLLIAATAIGQVYLEKQTRHRFAQLNLGVDFQSSLGGNFSYIQSNNNVTTLDFDNLLAPRFVIGGTHFWGHADIYIAIPLYNSKFNKDGQEVSVSSGVETVFKYYPWKIQHNKLRPFVGLSLTPFYYEQVNDNLEFGDGPGLNHTTVPVYGGFTFNHKNHLLELGLMWNYKNEQSYHISRTDVVDTQTPPFYINFSYRYMIETTIGEESNWENGNTKKAVDYLAEAKKLNNFYVGLGMSAAFWIKHSSYNNNNRPYIEDYDTSIMPDFTLGYYWNNIDLNVALSYRQYRTATRSYGAVQKLRRQSLVFEVPKFLFDYHGFVPYVGPAVSYEKLGFEESFEGTEVYDESQTKFAYGLTFGWDIRPNRLQPWILRTNLRWFPNLNLELDEENNIAFDNIEFNFIQFIMYPSRMFGKK